jgi:hypothetical protein
MTRVVKFIKPFSVYAVDDIAGLTEAEAREAIEAEAAVPYKAEKQTEKESEKEDPKKEEPKEETDETKSVDSPVEDKMAKNAPVKK